MVSSCSALGAAGQRRQTSANLVEVRKVRVLLIVSPCVIRHTRRRQGSLRQSNAPNLVSRILDTRPHRLRRVLTPSEIDGCPLRVEDHLRVRQMVMNEPREGAPIAVFVPLQPVDEPGNDDASGSADPTIGVLVIPDVASVVLLVRGTSHRIGIAETVHIGAPEGGADRHMAEDRVERLPTGSCTGPVQP